jgi:hypothetical protein
MSNSETTTEPAVPVAELLDPAPTGEPPPGELAASPSVPARGSTWRDAMTGQLEAVWRDLGVRDKSRHRPVHAAPPDERADRIAAAGMGLLVLVGAVVTYSAVVGAIDPLLAPAPAGGAPPAVVRSVTPTPAPTPPTTEPAEVGASTEPTGPRARSRATAPATSRQSVPTATPTPTTPPPTTTSQPPSPTPSPSG